MPKILIAVAGVSHHSAARMPEAFKRAGWAVGVVCRSGSSITYSSFADRAFQHRETTGIGQGNALKEAIESWRPDLVVPADDVTLWIAVQLHAYMKGKAPASQLTAILDRSLCPLEHQADIVRKSRLGEIASSLGVRVPAQIVDPQPDAAAAFAADHGYPVLVKYARTFNGSGVRLCRSTAELHAELARISGEINGFRGERSRAVQKFIDGETASVSFAAIGGRLIAGYAIRLVETYPPPFGAGSVVQHLDDPRLLEATAAIVGHFGLTGLGGADFRIDADGLPHLLEFNARLVGNTYLGPHFGVDLCAALRAGLDGRAYEPGPVREAGTVAAFPTEWNRDPNSPYLRGCHDVPWNDPRLLQYLTQLVGSRLKSPA